MQRTLPSNPVGLLFAGFSYPLRAFGFIRQNGLWAMTAVSIGVNAVLLVVLLALTFTYLTPWLDGAVLAIQTYFEAPWLQSIMGALGWLFKIAVYLVAIGLAALFLVMVGQAVASPFLDILSEKVEAIALGVRPPPTSVARAVRGVVIALGDLFWGVVFMVLLNVPIWVLGFWAPPISGPLSFIVSAMILAHEFISFPMARRFVDYRKRWAFVWQHKSLAVGFGTSVTGLLLVPGLNLLLLPLATVGGTLLYCDLER